MKVPSSSPSTSQRLIAVLLLAHLLAVLALAASPRLHAWLHPGEADDDGDCAVVLFLHGAVDGAALPVLVVVALVAWGAVFLAQQGTAMFVPTVFSRGRIFEHAPPAAV